MGDSMNGPFRYAWRRYSSYRFECSSEAHRNMVCLLAVAESEPMVLHALGQIKRHHADMVAWGSAHP